MFGVMIFLEVLLFGVVLFAMAHEEELIGVEERFVAAVKGTTKKGSQRS